MEIFQNFTRMQYRDGRPHLAEAHSPFEDRWVQDEWPGLDYFHSSYIDHVITGIAGLRPGDDGFVTLKPLAPKQWDYFALDGVEYRGHQLTILWDRHGTRYRRGKGFQLFVDGKLAASNPELTALQAALLAAVPVAQAREIVLSTNCENRPFPKASASFSAKYTPANAALSGLIWFDEQYGEKWTCRGSWRDEDWFQVTLEHAELIDTVRLYFYEDTQEVQAPESCRVLYLADAEWMPVEVRREMPQRPVARCAHTVHFKRVRTPAVRVVFHHPRGMGVGLSQIHLLRSDDPV